MKVKILVHNTKPDTFGYLLEENDMVIETSTPSVFHDNFDFKTQCEDTFNIEQYHEEIWELSKSS